MFCITIKHKNSYNTFFLTYCKNITNFLFWVRWTCLAISIENDKSNLQKLWCLFACKNCTPSLTSFWGYRTSRMLDHAHQYCSIISYESVSYQLARSFNFYLHCLSKCKHANWASRGLTLVQTFAYKSLKRLSRPSKKKEIQKWAELP